MDVNCWGKDYNSPFYLPSPIAFYPQNQITKTLNLSTLFSFSDQIQLKGLKHLLKF